MLGCMIFYENDLKLSQKKQLNSHSHVRLATSLMNFQFHTCGLFEGLSNHK